MRHRSVLFILGLLAPQPTHFEVFAQSLTWNECVMETKNNNDELKAAFQTLEAVTFQEKSVRGSLWPQVSGNVSYRKKNDASDSYVAELSASQNIFSGLSDYGKIQQAKAKRRAAEAAYQISKAKVSYDLISSFEGVVYSKASKELLQDIVRRREDNLRLVQLRFDGGRENKGSVLLSEAYLEQARYEYIQTQNDHVVAISDLYRVLGRDYSTLLETKDEVPTHEPPPEAPNFGAIATSTPEHQQAIADQEAAHAAITTSRSSFLPTLGANGNIGKEDSNFFPGNNLWSVGLSLTVPLFNGGRDYYGTRSSYSSWGAALAQQERTNRLLIPKLQAAFRNYQEAALKFKVDDRFLIAAKARSEIARNKYDNGLLSFEDWDIIENDLIARQKTLLQSRKDRTLREAVWLQVQGKDVFHD